MQRNAEQDNWTDFVETMTRDRIAVCTGKNIQYDAEKVKAGKDWMLQNATVVRNEKDNHWTYTCKLCDKGFTKGLRLMAHWTLISLDTRILQKVHKCSHVSRDLTV